MFFPLYFLIWISLILGLCFAIVYAGKAIFRIKKEEISNVKGSLVSMVFPVWGINIGAWFISYILLVCTISDLPFFESINSEWGIAYENAFLQAYVFLACWAVLYAALMIPAYFIFKGRILDVKKRKSFFAFFIIMSVLIGIAFYTYLIFRPE